MTCECPAVLGTDVISVAVAYNNETQCNSLDGRGVFIDYGVGAVAAGTGPTVAWSRGVCQSAAGDFVRRRAVYSELRRVLRAFVAPYVGEPRGGALPPAVVNFLNLPSRCRDRGAHT